MCFSIENYLMVSGCGLLLPLRFCGKSSKPSKPGCSRRDFVTNSKNIYILANSALKSEICMNDRYQ
jgi:hypothetical protein